MNKESAYNIAQDIIKFEDSSDLYRVGTKDYDFIGVNEKTQKVTLATYCNGTRSTCFSQTVDTKKGQEYHFSINIESNKVTKDTIGRKTATHIVSIIYQRNPIKLNFIFS